eukprot:768291-Hanusia_phi.AAC.4
MPDSNSPRAVARPQVLGIWRVWESIEAHDDAGRVDEGFRERVAEGRGGRDPRRKHNNFPGLQTGKGLTNTLRERKSNVNKSFARLVCIPHNQEAPGWSSNILSAN